MVLFYGTKRLLRQLVGITDSHKYTFMQIEMAHFPKGIPGRLDEFNWVPLDYKRAEWLLKTQMAVVLRPIINQREGPGNLDDITDYFDEAVIIVWLDRNTGLTFAVEGEKAQQIPYDGQNVPLTELIQILQTEFWSDFG